MKLVYLHVNCVWAFLFGDSLISMGSFGLLFNNKQDAVNAAQHQGLTVTSDNNVICMG